MPTFLANAAALMLQAAALAIQPPERVDFEHFAVDNIVFSKRESSLTGPYNPQAFPFFSEILEGLGPDDPCRIVTLQGSAQIGKTVLANIFTLGVQAMDPGDFMFIHPTEDNAVRWSKIKLKPMLKATAAVARMFPERSRDGGDSILFKERIDGRGSILISGANSPSSLSQVSVPYQVQDDLSKWTLNEAGDPEQQADSRSRGFEFAKIFKISTPLVNPGCKITRNYQAGSQEKYLVPCPHCGFEHALEWANMLANLDEGAPEKAHFTCPECGGEIEEHHRRDMVLRGHWHAQNPAASRHHRSFHLWSAYAPLQSWELIAREWLKAKGDPKAEQVFLNDTAGLAFDAKGEAPPWEGLRDRAAKSPHERGHVPLWGLVLTMGVDCQKDRVEWQVVAWSRDGRRHTVDKGVVLDHISEETCRKGLDNVMALQWRHASGRRIGIDLTAIDGNAWTEDVWQWARRHPISKVIMVRGVGHDNAPLVAKVKRERNRRGEILKYAGRFFHMGTSPMKMALYRNLGKDDPAERGYVSFPNGLEDEYFRQLTAESRRAVRRKDGFVDYKWDKDPNQANEMLDTMVQAEGAAHRIGIRTLSEDTWNRLEAERASPLPELQMDLEDLMGPGKAAAVPPKQPAQAPAVRRGVRSRGIA